MGIFHHYPLVNLWFSTAASRENVGHRLLGAKLSLFNGADLAQSAFSTSVASLVGSGELCGIRGRIHGSLPLNSRKLPT